MCVDDCLEQLMPLRKKSSACHRRQETQEPRQFRFLAFAVCVLVLFAGGVSAAQVPVRHREGLVHGFLALRTLQGEIIADGDLIQNVRGDRVTSRLVFHFKDGSLHDETAVFSQRGHFRLISDHLVQRGPAFEHPLELTLNATTGEATVRYTEDGKTKVANERLHLPIDVANGLVLTLLKNLRPERGETKVGFVAATPKPRLVKFAITPQGEESFSTGDAHRKATHYVVKVEISGLSGVFAELLGKKPSDIHVWIFEGEAPAFVKFEGPLALGGPTWRIELVSPVWPSRAITPERQDQRGSAMVGRCCFADSLPLALGPVRMPFGPDSPRPSPTAVDE